MATIKDLLQLDIKKIENPKLKKQVGTIIEEHQAAEDKAFFLKEFQSNIDTVYGFVKEHYPDAIESKEEENPCGDDEEPTATNAKKKGEKKDKKVKKKKQPEKPKATKADTLEMNEGLKKCDRELKAFRAERRKLLPQKPPPTRYVKIKKHILGLGKLIPPKLKDDLDTQKITKKTMMKFHREILKIFKMTSLRNIDRDQNEIKEKFEKIEEKLES